MHIALRRCSHTSDTMEENGAAEQYEGGIDDIIILALLAIFPRSATMHGRHGLPLHYAMRFKASLNIINALLHIYPAASCEADPHMMLPINYLVPSGYTMAGAPSAEVLDAFICSASSDEQCTYARRPRRKQPPNLKLALLLQAWQPSVPRLATLQDARWLISKGVLRAAQVASICGMLLAKMDDRHLSIVLTSIEPVVFEMVETADNPVRAAVSAAKVFKERAQHATLITTNLTVIAERLYTLAERLLDVSSTAQIFGRTGEKHGIDELLLAQEAPFFGDLDKMFAGGALHTALDSKILEVIAAPATQALISRAWCGSESAFPLLTTLIESAHDLEQEESENEDRTADGLAAVVGGMSQSQLTLHAAELLHPDKVARTPMIQFVSVRLLEMLNAFLLYQAILDFGHDLRNHHDRETWSSLEKAISFTNTEKIFVCFLIGHVAFELGQMYERGLRRYLEDPWNYVDLATIFCVSTYAVLKSSAEWGFMTTDQVYYDDDGVLPSDLIPEDIKDRSKFRVIELSLLGSFRFLCITSIPMCFKLLLSLSINKKYGVFVLMVFQMVQDILEILVVWMAIMLSFGVCMYHIYKEKHPDSYGDILTTSITLMSAAMGDFDYEPFAEDTDKTGTFLLTLYLIVVLVLLLNLVIAKLSSTYEKLSEKAVPEWCMVYANIVADCQTPHRITVTCLAPPFNLFVLVLAPILCLWFNVKSLFVPKHHSQTNPLSTDSKFTCTDHSSAPPRYDSSGKESEMHGAKQSHYARARDSAADTVVKVAQGVMMCLPLTIAANA